jgi:hypothetical protein
VSAAAFGSHIPPLRLEPSDIRDALAAAELSEGEHYVEPGCGDGTGLLIAAAEFGARATGIELRGEAAARARMAASTAGVDASVHVGNVLDHDLSTADVMLLYLGAAFHDLLADRLEKRLAPTARVISFGWRVPGWRASAASDALPGAWIYRPADPAVACSLTHAHDRALPPATCADHVVLRAHRALAAPTLRFAGPAAAWLDEPPRRLAALRRGQACNVPLNWSAPAAGAAGALEIQVLDGSSAVGPEYRMAVSVAAD